MEMAAALRPDPEHKYLELRWQVLSAARAMAQQYETTFIVALERLKEAYGVSEADPYPLGSEELLVKMKAAVQGGKKFRSVIEEEWKKEDHLRTAVISLQEKKERLGVLHRRIEEIRRK
jgi:hypothetical protein